ncbi:MAG: hypothetical protein ACYS0E_18815 [Planctomycetota bacterium]|jgi:hypothetical protein
MRTKRSWIVGSAALLLGLSGVLGLVRAEVATGTPSFSDPLEIDNKYHPFVEFRLRVYEIQQGHTDATVIDVFAADTRTFDYDGGTVECACLQEWEVEDGEIVEISLNYFAQADDGTVYYFGETVDIYEDGEIVSHDGSWLVGGPGPGDPVDTATADDPAVFMPADPEIGDIWKPEDLPDDDIEEFVEAIKFRKKLQTPVEKFEDVLQVEERTPDVEQKWYAADIGFVKGKEKGEILMIAELIDAEDEEEMEEVLEELLEELLEDDE